MLPDLITDRLAVTAPNGHRLYGQLVRSRVPRGTRLPAVVLVPGGIGAGRTMVQRVAAKELAAGGMVVVGFNAQGRSSGKLLDRRSQGRNDFNGIEDQDGLAAVIRRVLSHPAVDPDRLGIYACSFGLVAAAGCLARHPDLPVRWLVDEEGPSDACAAMLCAWRLVEGPLAPSVKAAPSPVARPDSGRPDPSKALELFGHGCGLHGGTEADARWWREREAIRFLPSFRGRYLRLQAERDHVQPPHGPEQAALFHQPPRWWQAKHACDLVNAAIDGGVPWVRVNLPDQGNGVNETYDAERLPRLLSGGMNDHPRAWVRAVRELV